MDDSAMMHYRVEITAPEEALAKSLRAKPLLRRRKRWAGGSDVTVRILDREGSHVAVYHYPTNSEADALHNAIVDDLIRLDVSAFREKYKIF